MGKHKNNIHCRDPPFYFFNRLIGGKYYGI